MQSCTVLYLSALICIEWCHSTVTRDPDNRHSKARSQHILKLLYGAEVCACDCPGWTNLFPPCPGPLPQINLSSWKFPSTLLEDHSSNQMVGIRLQRGYTCKGTPHFSFTSVKNTADVPIRCLKDLLLLAARIDHKRIWRPLVIQDRKLQVKNLLRSRVAQEKRKRQKVTASVQTHSKLNSSPACRAKRSPPHVLDLLSHSRATHYYHC